jgi:hypothetical protein
MTIQELKEAIAYAKKINRMSAGDDDGELEQYFDGELTGKVHHPVSVAIMENHSHIIAYLENCSTEDRREVYTAIRDGLKRVKAINEGVVREGYERTVKLYRTICEENGWEAEVYPQISLLV